MKHIVDAGLLPDGLDLLSVFDWPVFLAPVALLVRTNSQATRRQFCLV